MFLIFVKILLNIYFPAKLIKIFWVVKYFVDKIIWNFKDVMSCVMKKCERKIYTNIIRSCDLLIILNVNGQVNVLVFECGYANCKL